MYDSSRKNKQSYSRNIKKDIETVLKLNIQNYPSTENEKGTIASYVSKKNNTLYNNEESKSKNQTNDGFNTLSISIRKLKTFFPNIKDEVFNENYTNGHIPSRTEHIKIEEKYKLKINQLTQKESELKKAQEKLEKNIQKLDKIMDDQKLSKEVINSVDNNSSKLEKIFAEKYINDINKILKNDKEKERKVNYLNTKEYQEQLNLFLLREDFTSKQKIKEINISLEKNIKRKNEKIEELNKVNDSLKKLHDKKKKEIEELYMHYLNILKEGNDTRNEGLSWIIREIFSLDKKVIVSFFPKFLDKLCIKYLFNITHINMEITEIEKKIKLCKKDFKDKGIIKVFEKTNNNDIFTQRNIVTQETLKKIKRQFTLNNNNMGKKNKSNEKNLFLKKMQKINQKNEKNEKIQKNFNSHTNHENKIFSSILQIHPVGQDEDEDKKHENDNNLPYINGDPNNFMNGKDMTLSYTNKFLKNELRTSTRIPPIIRLKDFDKMAFFKNCFTQGDIIKVNTFFALKLKLSKLREEKDILKTNEMDRIFKEFQRNNYEQRFNVDKIKVISALIGEDNINNELFRQERRERLYFEQISKSQLYNKKINYRAFNEKALNDNIEKLKTA
jgi:hypothetical protein